MFPVMMFWRIFDARLTILLPSGGAIIVTQLLGQATSFSTVRILKVPSTWEAGVYRRDQDTHTGRSVKTSTVPWYIPTDLHVL